MTGSRTSKWEASTTVYPTHKKERLFDLGDLKNWRESYMKDNLCFPLSIFQWAVRKLSSDIPSPKTQPKNTIDPELGQIALPCIFQMIISLILHSNKRSPHRIPCLKGIIIYLGHCKQLFPSCHTIDMTKVTNVRVHLLKYNCSLSSSVIKNNQNVGQIILLCPECRTSFNDSHFEDIKVLDEPWCRQKEQRM